MTKLKFVNIYETKPNKSDCVHRTIWRLSVIMYVYLHFLILGKKYGCYCTTHWFKYHLKALIVNNGSN